MLALLLGLMFVNELQSYLTRDAKAQASGKVRFLEVKQDLKRHVIVEEAMRTFVPVKQPRLADDSLKDDIDMLKKEAPKSADAAKLLAVVLYETKGNVRGANVQRLKRSSRRSDRIYGAIYGSDKLSATQLVQIQAFLLPKEDFQSKLALAHARDKAGRPDARAGLATRKRLLALAIGGVGISSIFLLGFPALIVLFLSSTRPMPGHPSGSLTVPQADSFARRAAQALGLYILVGLVVGALGYEGVPVSGEYFVGGTLTILMTYYLYKRPIRPLKGDSGLSQLGVHKPTVRLIGWGLLGALANAPIVVGLALLGEWVFRFLPKAHHPIEDLLGTTNVLTILALLFAASVQAPFFEEILFRGTLFPAFTAIFKKPLWGGVVSSVLFAVIHPTGIPAWPALAAIGGMSAFLCYRTKSLVPSMTMHCVHNAATLLVGLLFS